MLKPGEIFIGNDLGQYEKDLYLLIIEKYNEYKVRYIVVSFVKNEYKCPKKHLSVFTSKFTPIKEDSKYTKA